MRIVKISLFVSILLLLLKYIGYASDWQVGEKYLCNISRLDDTCHDSYTIVIPCGAEKIIVEQVFDVWVKYRYRSKDHQYNTFKDYLTAIYKVPNFYTFCHKNEGYKFKDTEAYKDYLKIGFQEFLRKYTYEKYVYTYNGEYDKCVFLKDSVVYEWHSRGEGVNTYAAVKILFDHQYYIQQPEFLRFYFLKNYHECKRKPKMPPPPVR